MWCTSQVILTSDYEDMSLPNKLDQLETKPEKTVRVGVLGLMYKSWVETSVLNRVDYRLEKCNTVAKELSKMLKEKYKCDLVTAVTHMSNEEDMNLQNLQTDVDVCKGISSC
jgi:hypothetical protein